MNYYKKVSLLSYLLIFALVCFNSVTAGIIHSGDVLDIFVKEHEEMSKKVIVKEDGTVDYPFIGERSLLGMTPTEVGDILIFKLAKSIEAPFVLVTLSKHMPIKVRVLGQVLKPGLVELVSGVSLQEIITAAGGPTEFADLSNIKVIHEKNENDPISVNYKKFLTSGDLNILPDIKNNDIIIVLSISKNLKAKVIGCVNKPGYYTVLEETNLFDAIYMAGGPADRADLSRIRLVRKNNKDNENIDETVDLQRYIDSGKIDDIPKVKEGDTVVVYKKFFSWKVFLQFVRDALVLFTAYHVFTGSK